jgi:Domain of unknown function (DUF4416)
MSERRPIVPALLVVAAFSRHADALNWGREQLEQTYGPLALHSEPFAFTHTGYYESTMGANLLKQLFAFQRLIAPDILPDIKRNTNALEQQLAAAGNYPEERSLNLDPGYLVLGKFLLATTKDQSHRIYLRDGIFAEVTLRFQAGAWEPWPWTYADYREPFVREFLLRAREFYREQLH